MRVFRVKDICLRTQRKLGFKTGPILVLKSIPFMAISSFWLRGRCSGWPGESALQLVTTGNGLSQFTRVRRHLRRTGARFAQECFELGGCSALSRLFCDCRASCTSSFYDVSFSHRIHIFPHDARSTRAQRGSGYNVCFNLGTCVLVPRALPAWASRCSNLNGIYLNRLRSGS